MAASYLHWENSRLRGLQVERASQIVISNNHNSCGFRHLQRACNIYTPPNVINDPFPIISIHDRNKPLAPARIFENIERKHFLKPGCISLRIPHVGYISCSQQVSARVGAV